MNIKKPLELVLLIDDNEDDNFFHKIVIKKSGVAEKVEVCTTAVAALEYFENLAANHAEPGKRPIPDIVFLDVNMPKMNGWDFLHELSKLDLKLNENLVIVMLTTSPNPEESKKAADFKMLKKFLNKPLKSEHLEQIIHEYFPDRL